MATTLTYFTANTTLTAGTYFINYDINANGYTLTFNCASGPIIIKRKGDYSFAQLGAVSTTNSTATNKVIWTVFSDDTVGDTHPDSTGTPVKAGLELQSMSTITDAYLYSSAITLSNHEIRYADNKQFVSTSGTSVKNIQNIVFKNSDYSSVIIFKQTAQSGLGYNYFRYIQFDSTNTMTGTANLVSYLTKTYVDYIFVENANTTTPVLNSIHNDTFGAILSNTYIKIKNAGGYGIYTGDTRTAGHVYKFCSATFNVHYSGVSTSQTWDNCLFDATLTGYSDYAIYRLDSNYDCNITTTNCIFKGYTKVYFNREYGGNRETYITATNCIFDSNTQLLNNDDLGHQTANYNGYYNNGETYWTRGANDFTANPSFGAIVEGSVLDTSNAPYDLPTGYVATAAEYNLTGSDTYDNLGIDETVYSPNGYEHAGTAKVNPGIYYKFTTMVSSGIEGTGDLTLPKVVLVAEAYLIHIATSAIVLPLPSLQATGVKVLTAEGDVSLPIIQIASEGYLTHFGSSSISLPTITLSSEGYLTRFATSAITLPILTVSSIGNKFNAGTSELTLPTITLSSLGHFISGSVALTLPILTLSSTGIKATSGSCELTLPILTVSSLGTVINRYGTSEINLPILTIESTGYKFNEGVGSLTLPKLTLASEGFYTHLGSSAITLPKIRLASSGHRNRIGSSAITLPKLILVSIGNKFNAGTSAITLPKLTLACSAFKYDEIGTASLTLPKLTLQAAGLIANMGTISVTLPKLRLSATGIQIHFGTAPIVLPSISLHSVGHRNRIGTSAFTLPSIILVSKGNRVRIGTSELYLPYPLILSAVLYKYNSGVELDLYTALKKQLQEDIELQSIIVTWIFDNKRRIMQNGDYPSLQLIAKGIIDEKFIGYPMNKLVTEEFEVKARISRSDDPETYAVRLGENIKDAFERDINVGTTASMLYIGDAIIDAKSDDIRIIRIPIKAVTRKFYAPTERN